MKYLLLLLFPTMAFGAKFEVSGEKSTEAKVSGKAVYYATSTDSSCVDQNGPWQDPTPKKREKTILSKAANDDQYKLTFNLNWGENSKCKWALEWINIDIEGAQGNGSITMFPGTDYQSANVLNTVTCSKNVGVDNERMYFNCSAPEAIEPTFLLFSIPKKTKLPLNIVYRDKINNPIDGEPLKTVEFADAQLEIYANENGVIGANSPIVLQGSYHEDGLKPGRFDVKWSSKSWKSLTIDDPEDSEQDYMFRIGLNSDEAEEFAKFCNIIEDNYNLVIRRGFKGAVKDNKRNIKPFMVCLKAK